MFSVKPDGGNAALSSADNIIFQRVADMKQLFFPATGFLDGDLEEMWRWFFVSDILRKDNKTEHVVKSATGRIAVAAPESRMIPSSIRWSL